MIVNYFTFGQNHTHRYGLVTLDCDSVVKITAVTSMAAREIMFNAFGAKWSMQYSEAGMDMSFFPRGVVLELGES